MMRFPKYVVWGKENGLISGEYAKSKIDANKKKKRLTKKYPEVRWNIRKY